MNFAIYQLWKESRPFCWVYNLTFWGKLMFRKRSHDARKERNMNKMKEEPAIVCERGTYGISRWKNSRLEEKNYDGSDMREGFEEILSTLDVRHFEEGWPGDSVAAVFGFKSADRIVELRNWRKGKVCQKPHMGLGRRGTIVSGTRCIDREFFDSTDF